jgi:hypothetical protein
MRGISAVAAGALAVESPAADVGSGRSFDGIARSGAVPFVAMLVEPFVEMTAGTAGVAVRSGVGAPDTGDCVRGRDDDDGPPTAGAAALVVRGATPAAVSTCPSACS